MTRIPVRLALSCLLLASAAVVPASGQLQGGDYVVMKYGTPAIVWRVTPAGVISTLFSGFPLSRLGQGMAVTPAMEVVLADPGAGRIYRIPAPNQITTVASNISYPASITLDRNGDYIVLGGAGTTLQSALLRVTPNGAVSTIRLLPFNAWGVTTDANGDFLIADATPLKSGLVRVTRAGAMRTIHRGAPFRQAENPVVLGNGDFAVYDGVSPASVFRVPRGGGAVSTIYTSPAPLSSHDMSADFSGGLVLGESHTLATARILQVAADGTSRIVAQGSPLTNLGDVARAPHINGPWRGVPGGSHAFLLHFPGEAGRLYAAFASLSQFPGIGLPAPDPRRTPLNPDQLFFRSVGANDPIFVGWGGRLSALGRAGPVLNVPAAPFPRGFTVFVQAVTFDPGAPSGVRSFANVHTLVF